MEKKIKTNITELVFILDRSGSMSGLEDATKGGYNSVLKTQKEEPGTAFVTTVLFDDSYELLHDRINIRELRPITGKEYFVRGSTALLDAVGKTISRIGNDQKHADEGRRADKVMIVIITDGMENASREYTYQRVMEMINRQKSRYGWEFLFLGANIDAIATAAKFGIDADRAANYHADSKGTRLNYEAVSNFASNLRNDISNDAGWKKKIDEDYKKRGKK
ncbi:MAG: hypothetical protein H6Q58_1977 [Firmicutes bacterium]|nr:hypothetical protein [Bacillota bacterium]